MALQTKDYSITAKSINNTNTYVYTLRVTENSIDKNTNTSNLTVAAIVKCTNYDNIISGLEMTVDCTLNGVQVFANTDKRTLGKKNTENVFHTWTGDVVHNEDGSLTLAVGGSLTHKGTNGYMPTTPMTIKEDSTNAMTLTKINRGLTHIGDGTEFEVFQAYIHNGTAWDNYIPYIHNGVTWEQVGGNAEPSQPSYDPVFANNTWEQIAEACHTRRVPSTWSVGDQKTMTINGVDYGVDIIGKNHDDYADGSGKAPLTFQLHDCLPSLYRMNVTSSNKCGWHNSEFRTTSLPNILATIPVEVQNNLKEVNKVTSKGDQSAELVTTADKLFLLSEIEVFGTIHNAFPGEGVQYEYYLNGNSAIKNNNDGARHWWLRSPADYNTTHFCYVNYNTGTSYAIHAGNSNYIAFAFCF